jgi:hypothetical protein
MAEKTKFVPPASSVRTVAVDAIMQLLYLLRFSE